MKNQHELAFQQDDGSGPMPEVVDGKVDARNVHEALGVASEFAKWFERRVTEFGFVEGEDFSSCVTKTALGRNRTDFVVSLDMAKELAMVERNEMGRKMRRYFIECEKRLVASVAPALVNDPMPPGVLLKIQQINAGMIEVVGEHATRIAHLEATARPGPDWLMPKEWLDARGISWPQPFWTGRLTALSGRLSQRSAGAGLPVGRKRLGSGREVRTFSPALMDEVIPMYLTRWAKRDAAAAAGTEGGVA